MCEQLELILDLQFKDQSLLLQALTHRSFIHDAMGAGQSSNERLEFLGDSILALVSADYLYRTFPELSEGELTDVRAALVRTPTLAQFAREISLSQFLRMGKGEQQAGSGQRILGSAFEAILGALYLDQGLHAVQIFLLPRLEPMAHDIVARRLFKDNKSRFQELAQAQEGITPAYRVVSQEGPAHDSNFSVEVLLGEEVVGTGHGKNKQAAEQEAAREALTSRGWL